MDPFTRRRIGRSELSVTQLGFGGVPLGDPGGTLEESRAQATLAAAALQFPLGHPAVASVIPGADSPEQVRQNLDNMRRPIPADLWAELKQENLIRDDAPTPT